MRRNRPSVQVSLVAINSHQDGYSGTLDEMIRLETVQRIERWWLQLEELDKILLPRLYDWQTYDQISVCKKISRRTFYRRVNRLKSELRRLVEG